MAKKNTAPKARLGAGNVRLIGSAAARIVPNVRAAHGLASALVALYKPQLDDAEDTVRSLGNQASNDACAAYSRALMRARELRGVVAIAGAAADELESSLLGVERILSLTKGCRK